jgi:sec-independent protein translocase protein TatB
MFDIGIGEILLLAIVGLLVFGPDRLPRAAADAGKWIRTIREMAAGARKDLADSAGIDFTETLDSVRELRDLHPRNLATGFLADDAPKSARSNGAGPVNGAGAASKKRDDSAVPTFDPDAL